MAVYNKKLPSPFPYFGGKSRVADLIWSRFGTVKNYVEPFFGSGAVLLARPGEITGTETVNDADGMVANFWRALKTCPELVAEHADHPVNENDLHARHAWLVRTQLGTLAAKLEGDPEWCDPKVAGWWVWGMACWIGSGFCSGKGPWAVDVDGSRQLVRTKAAGQGVNRKRVHLGNAGQGVNRKRVHLLDYMTTLAERLRDVRVCCGDWERVCGPTPLFPSGKTGHTAVFLDPPYTAEAGRTDGIYAVDDLSVGHRAALWARAHGGDQRLRIALCGYEGEYDFPGDWECIAWKAEGGYGGQSTGRGRKNSGRERVWFSPGCVGPRPRRGSLVRVPSWMKNM